MKLIKEFFGEDGEPVVLVSSFVDCSGLAYAVDNLTLAGDFRVCTSKTYALDIAQAITNRYNRKINQ